MASAVDTGLKSALRGAVESNEGYQAALRFEEEAALRIGVASSVRKPQISGNADLGMIRETGGIQPDDTTTGLAAGFNISQLVFDGGASSAEVNSATAEALAARAERDVRGNEIALEAARAWIDVWQFAERLALLKRRTREMNRLIAQMERMAANGLVDRAAMASAQRQVVDITLEEARLQAQLDAATLRFERFFRSSVNDVPQPDSVLTFAEAEAAANSWHTAPVLQRTAAETMVARQAVERAEAAYWPTARVQAGVSSPMEERESTDTIVGLRVDYMFGEGGRRSAELAAARARAAATSDELADAQQALQVQLKAALRQLRSIDASMPLVSDQIRLSASEADTAESQIRTGQSSLRQLVEAEIENYRAQDRQIVLRAQRHTELFTVAARTGELTRKLGIGKDTLR